MPSWRPAWGMFRTANTTGFPKRVATAWTPRVGDVRLGHRANTNAQRDSYAKTERGLATPLAIFAAVSRTRGPASFVAISWASARALPASSSTSATRAASRTRAYGSVRAASERVASPRIGMLPATAATSAPAS